MKELSEKLLRQYLSYGTEILDKAPFGVFIVQNRTFKWGNKKFIKATGHSLDRLLGMNPLNLVRHDFRQFVRERAVEMLRGVSSEPYEYCIITGNGDERWIKETVMSIQYLGGKAVLGFYMDISDTIRATITDGLTGINNRFYFNTLIARETKRSERYQIPLSMAILDIDHFKQYNDKYGHPEGDNALVTVAGTIAETIRQELDTAFRYGGEEFVVVFPGTSGNHAFAAGKRICRAVEDGTGFCRSVTISGGVAQFKYGEAIDDFIKRTDLRLYKAKKTRNTIIYR